jgi:predicted transposase YdaD
MLALQQNQTSYSRMLEYWIRLWRLHGKPIHQVVLYLRKTNSPLVQVDELQVGETRHRYGVVRLWEQDPLPLLQNPALLPLATLARKAGRSTSADAEHLALVADRVAAIKNPVLQKEIAGGCHLLAGLGFSQELINAYFTMGILDDSVTYQAAVAEYTRRGRLEGERQGEERGLQLGLNQGLNQGLQQEAQSLVLRQLPRRCGQLSHEQELAVRALPLEKLEALAEALLDFDGPEALDAWLAV